MGRLLTVHPCPLCNYYVEDTLHEGGSGIAPMFLRNHYSLAICKSCKHLVSVLVANTDIETQHALERARRDVIQMEADAIVGDRRARDLLPLFKLALDTFDDTVPLADTTCTMCGETDIEVIADVGAEEFDAHDAWVQCPECGEGKLLIETSGSWD